MKPTSILLIRKVRISKKAKNFRQLIQLEFLIKVASWVLLKDTTTDTHAYTHFHVMIKLAFKFDNLS